MKFSSLVTVALLGGVSATPTGPRSNFTSDVIMVEGLHKLSAFVAKNGYPDAKKCTLKKASVRREW
jgi:tyrosinase